MAVHWVMPGGLFFQIQQDKRLRQTLQLLPFSRTSLYSWPVSHIYILHQWKKGINLMSLWLISDMFFVMQVAASMKTGMWSVILLNDASHAKWPVCTEQPETERLIDGPPPTHPNTHKHAWTHAHTMCNIMCVCTPTYINTCAHEYYCNAQKRHLYRTYSEYDCMMTNVLWPPSWKEGEGTFRIWHCVHGTDE